MLALTGVDSVENLPGDCDSGSKIDYFGRGNGTHSHDVYLPMWVRPLDGGRRGPERNSAPSDLLPASGRYNNSRLNASAWIGIRLHETRDMLGAVQPEWRQHNPVVSAQNFAGVEAP